MPAAGRSHGTIVTDVADNVWPRRALQAALQAGNEGKFSQLARAHQLSLHHDVDEFARNIDHLHRTLAVHVPLRPFTGQGVGFGLCLSNVSWGLEFVAQFAVHLHHDGEQFFGSQLVVPDGPGLPVHAIGTASASPTALLPYVGKVGAINRTKVRSASPQAAWVATASPWRATDSWRIP